MNLHYEIFPAIRTENCEYTADVKNRKSSLQLLVEGEVFSANSDEHKKIWWHGGASTGKTVSSKLLQLTYPDKIVLLPLKRMNYDQWDYIAYLDQIKEMPNGTVYVFDGYDQLRNDDAIVEKAHNCFCIASKIGHVIVTSRSLYDKSQLTMDFQIAETLPITDEQIRTILSPLRDNIETYVKSDLMHNVMYLSIVHQLLEGDPGISFNEMNEAELIDAYFLRFYGEEGSEHENKCGRCNQYEKDIKSIGEVLYHDIGRVSVHKRKSHQNDLKLYPVDGIPKVLQEVFSIQFEGINSDQRKYLSFALAKYLFSIFEAERDQAGDDEKFLRQMQYQFLTLDTPDAFWALYYVGQLYSLKKIRIDIDLGIMKNMIPISIGAVMFCIGQDISCFDAFFEKDGWGTLFLNRQKIYESFINERFNTVKIENDNCRVPSYYGTFKNNVPDGLGIMIWSDDQCYEGQWENGCRQGNGIMRYSDGGIYVGAWEHDQRSGKGTYSKNGYRYVGEWKNGQKEGDGEETYPDGSQIVGKWKRDSLFYGKMTWNNTVYEGYWKDNYYDGHGVLTSADGIVYDCEWKHGMQEGNGKMTSADGLETYEGKWSDGTYEGYGVFFSKKEGYMYQGQWHKGHKHGEGRYISLEEDIVFEGIWKDDIRHGKGKATLPNGDVLDGEWDDALFSGTALLHYSTDEWYNGSFCRGERHGEGCMHYKDGTQEQGQWYHDYFVGDKYGN